ncbi:MAG: hypothetical protein PF689_02475 [Deltaproteobacteria bacterium]|jgi:tetratricopeptide (TPR) repeat protein|nr:hypothetical protein [Deltaproteobacteria bacterium]
MKNAIITVLLMVFIPAFASAECPKKSEKQLRIYKMKAIEKLVGYEFLEAKKFLDKASPFLKGCETSEQGLAVQQLIGITVFSLKKYPEAKAAFRKLFKLDLDNKLNEKLVTPKLKAFYEGIRQQYKNELKQKADTKAKIKKLENATGMPPEPKENPKVPLEHTPRENGLRGRKFTVFCRVQDEMKVAKVQLFVKDGNAYNPIDMKKIGIRRYIHTLSGKKTSSSELSYYIMAFNKDNKPVAASGNSANSHTVTLRLPEEKDSVEKGKDKKETVIKESVDEKKDKKDKKVKQVDTEEEEKIKEIIDEPDEIKKARDKAKRVPWDSGPAPLLFLSVSGGYGAGLVGDRSEALKTELNSGFAPAKTMQIEAGYMYSRLSAFTLLVQMGFNSVDNDILETQSNSQDFFFTDSMRNDYRIFVRYRSMLVPQKVSMFSWRPFWGVGMGGGRLRHEVPAEKENNNTITEKKDTHFSSGTMLNAFGGAMLCLTNNCSFSLQAEVDYTATISVENSNYAHFDFLFGLNFIF